MDLVFSAHCDAHGAAIEGALSIGNEKLVHCLRFSEQEWELRDIVRRVAQGENVDIALDQVNQRPEFRQPTQGNVDFVLDLVRQWPELRQGALRSAARANQGPLVHLLLCDDGDIAFAAIFAIHHRELARELLHRDPTVMPEVSKSSVAALLLCLEWGMSPVGVGVPNYHGGTGSPASSPGAALPLYPEAPMLALLRAAWPLAGPDWETPVTFSLKWSCWPLATTHH